MIGPWTATYARMRHQTPPTRFDAGVLSSVLRRPENPGRDARRDGAPRGPGRGLRASRRVARPLDPRRGVRTRTDARRSCGATFPKARYTGLEVSEYLCRKHGWIAGVGRDVRPAAAVRPRDLLRRDAIPRHARGGRGAAQPRPALRTACCISARSRRRTGSCTATSGGRTGTCRSDRRDWYRRRLARVFHQCGHRHVRASRRAHAPLGTRPGRGPALAQIVITRPRRLPRPARRRGGTLQCRPLRLPLVGSPDALYVAACLAFVLARPGCRCSTGCGTTSPCRPATPDYLTAQDRPRLQMPEGVAGSERLGGGMVIPPPPAETDQARSSRRTASTSRRRFSADASSSGRRFGRGGASMPGRPRGPARNADPVDRVSIRRNSRRPRRRGCGRTSTNAGGGRGWHSRPRRSSRT